jgi:hypothetical protein
MEPVLMAVLGTSEALPHLLGNLPSRRQSVPLRGAKIAIGIANFASGIIAG